MTNGVLEIAPREFFDRRERTLVTYDLSGIISARHETFGEDREKVVPEIQSLICNFVSAEDWRDNGGELAQMSVVGDRLFVEAPRMHPQVKWILDQLPSDKKHTDAGAECRTCPTSRSSDTCTGAPLATQDGPDPRLPDQVHLGGRGSQVADEVAEHQEDRFHSLRR